MSHTNRSQISLKASPESSSRPAVGAPPKRQILGACQKRSSTPHHSCTHSTTARFSPLSVEKHARTHTRHTHLRPRNQVMVHLCPSVDLLLLQPGSSRDDCMVFFGNSRNASCGVLTTLDSSSAELPSLQNGMLTRFTAYALSNHHGISELPTSINCKTSDRLGVLCEMCSMRTV